MNKILITTIGLILLFKLSNVLMAKSKRTTHLKAGKRWDEIVKELSQRLAKVQITILQLAIKRPRK